MLESLLADITDFFPKRDKTCLKNILLLCLGILEKETVNLNRIKNCLGRISGRPGTSADSHYKRLIRIFDNFSFSSLWVEIVAYGVRLLRLKTEHLLLDGTGWKSGRQRFHYLTLCIVHKNVAVPVFWIDLKKHGNSNFEERKKLICRAFKFFDLKGKTLIADREYIGQNWFKFLIGKGLNFVIRSKANTYTSAINGSPGKSFEQLAKKVLRSKVPYKAVRKRFYLNGMGLYLVIAKNPDRDPKEPFIILITNLDRSAYRIASDYLVRWKIEHCFFHLKSNGFNLESINLKSSGRRKLLMAVVVLAYVLSVHEGLKTYGKVAIKTYANGETWRSKSVFRYGMEKIVRYCGSMLTFCRYLDWEVSRALKAYNSHLSLNVQ